MIDFEKVSKARALFKERGAIRREYIRDEIAYSWVRSRLYSRKKVEFKEENARIFIDEIEYTADEIIEFIKQKLVIDEKKYSVLIVGEDGSVKNTDCKNTMFGIKMPNSFREEHIGTNGIGIGFSLKKSVIVYGSEHYNDVFDDYISASILDIPFEVDKGVLGVIAKKDTFDDRVLDEIKNINYSLIRKKSINVKLIDSKIDKSKVEKTEIEPYKIEENKIENDINRVGNSAVKTEKMSRIIEDLDYSKVKIPYCLVGKSEEKVNLKTLVMTKSLASSLINIYGREGSGREYLARFIHENSNRKDYGFIRINPRIDIGYVIDREIDQFQSGTLYIEHINELTKASMSKLQRKINCKLVNSKTCNLSNESNVAFIISNGKFDITSKKEDLFLTSLKLEIKDIDSCEDDLQYLISKLLEDKLKSTKGIKNLEIFSPIYIHAKSKEILKVMLEEPSLTYRGLERILDMIINITPKSVEVNQLKVELVDQEINKNFKTLKDIELEYIREVMKYTGDNIAKASEILGIGRTTIYRKLKND